MADPKCCICGNAYGTRRICTLCKADPANSAWREAEDAELSWHTPPERGPLQLEGDAPTVRVWNPTPKQRAILQLAVAGGTVAGIVRLTGASKSYVKKTLRDFKLKGNK